MNLSRSAATGALTTLAGQAVRAVLQFGSVTALSRLLDPSDFGIYAMVFSLVGVASLLADFGLSMSTIQSQDISDAQRSNLLWFNIAFGLIITGIVFALASPISNFYNSPQLENVTRLLSVSFLIDATCAQFKAELNSKLRFAWLSAVDIISQAVGLATAVILAVAGCHYWALVWQQIAIVSVALLVAVVGAGWRPRFPTRHTPMRHLLSFGANTFGVQALVYITSNIDNVLLGKVTSPAILGAYNRAYQLFKLPVAQLAAPMTKVAFPILSRVQHDQVTYERYLLRAQLVLAYGLGGLFLALAGESSPLVDILLGNQWLIAKKLFVILAVGGCFQALGYIYYWIFLSRALTSIQVRFSLIGRGLMVVAIVLGLHWGAIGVAVGASAGQLVVWALNGTLAMPHAGVATRPLLAVAIRPMALFAPLTAGGLWFSHLMGSTSPWVEGIVIAGAMALYLLVAWALVPWFRRDARTLVSIVGKLRAV